MTNLADRNIDTYIINMLHSFKNIERNLNRVKTHMEDIFLEDQIGTLAIKIKMSQMKRHRVRSITDSLDTAKEKIKSVK